MGRVHLYESVKDNSSRIWGNMWGTFSGIIFILIGLAFLFSAYGSIRFFGIGLIFIGIFLIIIYFIKKVFEKRYR